MKFIEKYNSPNVDELIETEQSYISFGKKLCNCFVCGSLTKWCDLLMEKAFCSEECCEMAWKSFEDFLDVEKFTDEELLHNDLIHLKAHGPVDEWKDIIIVVKDQLDYFKRCIKSIQRFTKNYHLYIWDNGSGPETKSYLDRLQKSCPDTGDWNITVVNSDNNIGFIYPNNFLIGLGSSPYVIILNSDTEVAKYWDQAMMAYLKRNIDCLQVGYFGGHLAEDGRGFGGDTKDFIDYVAGWCFCVSRETYNAFGLFDEQLKFAYFEDSDFSLRLKKAGKKIYAINLGLVKHHQNKTIEVVEQEGKIDLQSTFIANQKLFQQRWKDYLQYKRVTLKSSDSSSIEQHLGLKA